MLPVLLFSSSLSYTRSYLNLLFPHAFQMTYVTNALLYEYCSLLIVHIAIAFKTLSPPHTNCDLPSIQPDISAGRLNTQTRHKPCFQRPLTNSLFFYMMIHLIPNTAMKTQYDHFCNVTTD